MNIEKDFIKYLKTLKPSKWQIKVNSEWTIKDAVAHMVGWEKIDPEIIRETWRTKKRPWFYETDDFDEFNRINVEFYKSYTPNQLIKEWEKWQDLAQKEIDKIGEKKLRLNYKLFDWLFGQDNYNSHYLDHLRQIKNTLKNTSADNYKKETFYLGKKPIADFYYKKNKKELIAFQNFEKEYKKLVDFFEVQPPKIKVKLVYTRKEMDQHWGSKSKIVAMVDNSDPYLIYIFSPIVFEKLTDWKKETMLSTIMHETAHAFVTQLNKRCFSWLNEGICEFITDDNTHDNIIKKSNWRWFKDNNILLDSEISWEKLMSHEGYKISYNLVKFIINKYGKKAVFDLIKIRRVKDKQIKNKFSKILDEDFEQFLADFERTLKYE